MADAHSLQLARDLPDDESQVRVAVRWIERSHAQDQVQRDRVQWIDGSSGIRGEKTIIKNRKDRVFYLFFSFRTRYRDTSSTLET